MKKYRLFGKIPVFDVVVIAVVLVAAIVFYKVFTTSKSGNRLTNVETKTVRYTVDFLNLSNAVDGVADPGEKVYDLNTNYEIGKVVSAKSRPFVANSFDSFTGEPVSTEYSDRQSITIVVEATAKVSEVATEINSVKIGIGKTMTFNMPSLCATGVIIDIEEV